LRSLLGGAVAVSGLLVVGRPVRPLDGRLLETDSQFERRRLDGSLSVPPLRGEAVRQHREDGTQETKQSQAPAASAHAAFLLRPRRPVQGDLVDNDGNAGFLSIDTRSCCPLG